MKNTNRLYWNEQMKELQEMLSHKSNLVDLIEQFLKVHAMVHSAQMSNLSLWSYEDELWEGLTVEVFSEMPKSADCTIAWHMWHISRIEDITMNSLIAGTSQIYDTDEWKVKLGVSVRDTGNSMSREEIIGLSKKLNMEALKKYRLLVGRRTEEIVKELSQEDLVINVSMDRINSILEKGDVLESAKGIANYWGKRTYAGLLTMPGSRHIFVHLNQATELKAKLSKKK